MREVAIFTSFHSWISNNLDQQILFLSFHRKYMTSYSSTMVRLLQNTMMGLFEPRISGRCMETQSINFLKKQNRFLIRKKSSILVKKFTGRKMIFGERYRNNLYFSSPLQGEVPEGGWGEF